MAKRLEADGEARSTRERILDCAAELFSRHGYAEGSIRNIAGAIGIKGPSVYHHFASKEEMTAALLREAARIAFAAIDRVDIEAFGDDRRRLLEAAIDAHFHAYLDNTAYLSALVRIFRQLPPELLAIGGGALQPYIERWVTILRKVGGGRVASDDDARSLAQYIFGAINSVSDWRDGSIMRSQIPRLRGLMCNMVIDGLAD